jgi:hypothetical protein
MMPADPLKLPARRQQLSPEKIPDEIVVKLPPSLRCPTLRNGVGIGLHYLAIGENPKKIPEILDRKEWVTARVPLTPAAKILYAQLLGRPEFPAKSDPLLLALAWVAEQPPHVRNIQID